MFDPFSPADTNILRAETSDIRQVVRNICHQASRRTVHTLNPKGTSFEPRISFLTHRNAHNLPSPCAKNALENIWRWIWFHMFSTPKDVQKLLKYPACELILDHLFIYIYIKYTPQGNRCMYKMILSLLFEANKDKSYRTCDW